MQSEFASWHPLRSGQAIFASPSLSSPFRLVPAISTEEAISFRQIHEPSGEPIRLVKGIETDKGFKEVPEDEIVSSHNMAVRHPKAPPRSSLDTNVKARE